LAHVVHRQRVTHRRADPRGLDGIVACLSPVGWLSLALAVLWMVVGLQPLTSPGVLNQSELAAIAMRILSTAADAALVALPAGLELGYPRVRRRNPWLWRGVTLMAVAQLARPVIKLLQTWIVENLDPGTEQVFNTGTALGLGFLLVSLLPGLLLIGALWALSDGLFDAGARPRRLVVPVMAVAGVVVTLLAYLPYLGEGLDLSTANGWTNLLGLSLSLLQIALWIAVGVRLVFGGAMGLLPRSAWLIGLLAGVLILLLRFGSPVTLSVSQDLGLGPIISGIDSALGILLLSSVLEGLGRGTRRRRILAPALRLFVVNPTD